jgi:hypothetical protein
MIKNRNIAADANIDLSKINLISGQRTLWEDFDEEMNFDGANLYGFGKVVKNSGVAVCDASSNLHADAPANADVILWYGSAMWATARDCTMGVRLVEVESNALVNFQIGWTDSAAIAVAEGAGPIMDAHDYGYVIFDTNESPNFRLATNVAGVGPVRVDTGIVVAAGSAIHDITVKINPAGTVTATIGDNVFKSTVAGAVKTGATDWHPFVRVHANGATNKSIKIDTFKVEQSRTDV